MLKTEVLLYKWECLFMTIWLVQLLVSVFVLLFLHDSLSVHKGGLCVKSWCALLQCSFSSILALIWRMLVVNCMDFSKNIKYIVLTCWTVIKQTNELLSLVSWMDFPCGSISCVLNFRPFNIHVSPITRPVGLGGSGGSDKPPPTRCRGLPRKDRLPICGASCHFGVMLVATV